MFISLSRRIVNIHKTHTRSECYNICRPIYNNPQESNRIKEWTTTTRQCVADSVRWAGVTNQWSLNSSEYININVLNWKKNTQQWLIYSFCHHIAAGCPCYFVLLGVAIMQVHCTRFLKVGLYGRSEQQHEVQNITQPYAECSLSEATQMQLLPGWCLRLLARCQKDGKWKQ